MSYLIDQKIGNEFDGEIISDSLAGYVFKITGGIDKDGFAMKNGVLTQERKRLLLKKGSKGIRFRRNFHRDGTRIRKLVRGCIVSSDIRMLHIKIVKAGEKQIAGLNDAEPLPRRLGPKIANNILKELGLIEVYNKMKQNPEERGTLRYMVTKYVNKREVKTKNGKVYTKSPKVQRLITPLRLRRKRLLKKAKKEAVQNTENQKKSYEETYKRNKNSKKNKTTTKKTTKTTKA